MKQFQIIGFAVLGLVFLGLAVYYFMTPAKDLLSFMPGYAAGSSAVHTKHGLAALVLALGCGVMAWFSMGKKASAGSDADTSLEA